MVCAMATAGRDLTRAPPASPRAGVRRTDRSRRAGRCGSQVLRRRAELLWCRPRAPSKETSARGEVHPRFCAKPAVDLSGRGCAQAHEDRLGEIAGDADRRSRSDRRLPRCDALLLAAGARRRGSRGARDLQPAGAWPDASRASRIRRRRGRASKSTTWRRAALDGGAATADLDAPALDPDAVARRAAQLLAEGK